MMKRCELKIVWLLWAGMFLAGCESQGETPFGKPCDTGADCISDFCVGGEAGSVLAPFCSDDCTNKKTGDECGGGAGKCIADFVSWCWLPCQTDAECAAVNPSRPVCSLISASGVDSPFKVCIGKPAM
ncbi:MAG TPA: hypothetical protein PKA58_00910 [Polyangium sp.]|jgi:hypothetical protein|nr:hypothetical protein [Polyangium sp.]